MIYQIIRGMDTAAKLYFDASFVIAGACGFWSIRFLGEHNAMGWLEIWVATVLMFGAAGLSLVYFYGRSYAELINTYESKNPLRGLDRLSATEKKRLIADLLDEIEGQLIEVRDKTQQPITYRVAARRLTKSCAYCGEDCIRCKYPYAIITAVDTSPTGKLTVKLR